MVPRQYHLLKEAPSKISSLVFPHFHLIISAEEWGKVKNGCSDAQGPSRALLLLRLSQSFILEWLSWRCSHSPDIDYRTQLCTVLWFWQTWTGNWEWNLTTCILASPPGFRGRFKTEIIHYCHPNTHMPSARLFSFPEEIPLFILHS